jgi:hypothetical protein
MNAWHVLPIAVAREFEFSECAVVFNGWKVLQGDLSGILLISINLKLK